MANFIDTLKGLFNSASTTWSPSLSWTGGTPASISASYWYVKIGKLCFFWAKIISADGNGATGLVIPLPINPKNNSHGVVVCSGYQVVTASYYQPNAAVDDGYTNIYFKTFQPWTDGQYGEIWVNGWYEVA